jgi:hypothetical protein
LMFSSCSNKKIILACYDCFRKLGKENPDIFVGSTRMDI